MANQQEEEEEYVAYITPAQRRKNDELNKKNKKRLVGGGVAVSMEMPQVKPILSPPAAIAEAPIKEEEESLLSIAKRMRREHEINPLAAQKRLEQEQEARILESALAASNQSLISVKERATDAQLMQRNVVKRAWCRAKSSEYPAEEFAKYKKLIIVDGDEVPQMELSFENMNLAPHIITWLRETKQISSPSPIQMQGLPVCLSGRDMIGVASTGSGKTLCFAIPAVMISLEEMQKYGSNAGPFVLILGPNRELQRQTFQIIQELCEAVADSDLRCTLAIGGEDKRNQLQAHRTRATQICIGTPGRVLDFLQPNHRNISEISLAKCTLLVLDEGDRMMDEGFDEVVKKIMGYFTPHRARQTALFSATMPRRVVEFARDALIRPVLVNVGRAGAASANICQHIEPMLRKEDRFVLLLQALQRTEPPVLIFSSKNNDVDDIHLYLLLKGLEARGIHAKKSQQERNQAVDDFKVGKADILVASDVGAKGLDFANIQHVINMDMPTEIENYVHRIGRTGRGVNTTGMSTTFIDLKTLNDNASVYADLAGILRDARQRIPKFLIGGEVGKFEEPATAEDEARNAATTCTVCGGFGHRVINCPKLSMLGRKSQSRDVVTGGDY